jgi:hypothetical protein
VAHRLSVAAGGAVLALLGTVSSAYAATGSPPVTHPDSVTTKAGEVTLIDPVDNDSDPDGDSLEVCRLGADVPRALSKSFVQDGDLAVVANKLARGTYQLTYYACDASYLTAGTVTVTVKPPAPTLDIVPVGDAPPGRVRIVNTYKHVTFHCQWGPIDARHPDGRATVKPHRTEVINLREAQAQVVCESPHIGVAAIFGKAGPARVEIRRAPAT